MRLLDRSCLTALALVLTMGGAFAESPESVEAALRAAEERLHAAAREVAELSSGLHRSELVVVAGGEVLSKKPRLGVQLSTETVNGVRTTEGIRIVSVSPGSAAQEAGLEPSDVIVSVNGESLRKVPADEAARIIGDKLAGKEIGDAIVIQVIREDKQRRFDIKLNEQSFEPVMIAGWPDEEQMRVLALNGLEEGVIDIDIGEHVNIQPMNFGTSSGFSFIHPNSAWSSMELVELSEELGEYFGAKEGLLVVRAPADASLGFEDGDVIRQIGDRTPENVGHAMRILRSYESGEALSVEILRHNKKRTLKIEVPEKVGATDVSFSVEWLEDEVSDSAGVIVR